MRPSEVIPAPALRELGCPLCLAELRATGPDLLCPRHGAVGSRDADGICVFDRSDDYWGEVSREFMRRVDDAARRDGWRAALDAVLRPAHPELADYVHHPARGDWRVLLALDREHTVAADIGAGWGANSFALAPHVARVYAVEKIPERVEFIALRARDEPAARVVPVRADLHSLPFAPASLDVCVVNGVLEWAGLADPEAARRGIERRSPRVLQEHFLRQLAGFLKPGGWLYVGIENRFGRMFWLGTPDHQGLRFTSLMPKPAARAYTWLRAVTSPRTHQTERDYRTWIYSRGGTERLIESCGFTDVESYAVMPGYNVPTVLVPLATPGPFLYLASRTRSPRRLTGTARRWWRAAMAASGLEAHVTSCFAIVARRAAGERA
jgi:SAM-dependent methyltransferase